MLKNLIFALTVTTNPAAEWPLCYRNFRKTGEKQSAAASPEPRNIWAEMRPDFQKWHALCIGCMAPMSQTLCLDFLKRLYRRYQIGSR
jgi:hypothetical protein